MERYILLVAFVCLIYTKGQHVDAFSFANSYAPNMVLHAAPRSAVVWGTADVEYIGREVKVIVTLNTKPVQPQPVTGVIMPGAEGDKGVWRVVLPQYPAGGPYTLTAILNTQTIQLKNILFGEVWICAGALNMEMETFKTFNGTEEVNGAATYENIRLQTITDRSIVPLDDIMMPRQPWTLPDSDSVRDFSSLCWTFGRKLHEHTGIPIGLIATLRGGNLIHQWTPPETLDACDGYAGAAPMKAWNAMIHPLLNMTVTGVIWYQGERNGNRPVFSLGYECFLPNMIRHWRQRFHAANERTDVLLPFGIVQIGGRFDNQIRSYESIRWMQTAEKALVPNKELPNTFMAVAMDLPDLETPWLPVQPRDKTTIAERLILGVRAIHLGEKDVEHAGPVPISYRFNPTANTLQLQYDKSKLIEIRSSDGFEICCSETLMNPCEPYDIRWKQVPISKLDNSTITLMTSECRAEHLLGQRYAWSMNPCAYKTCAVYSATSGLPAHVYKTAGRIMDDNIWHPIVF